MGSMVGNLRKEIEDGPRFHLDRDEDGKIKQRQECSSCIAIGWMDRDTGLCTDCFRIWRFSVFNICGTHNMTGQSCNRYRNHSGPCRWPVAKEAETK